MTSFKFKVPMALIALAILIRWLVALFPHSGYKSPPMYGDYEAQRHWMEITTNLPPQQWYENSTDNDLLYWGLDYPPLTAYHMFGLGYASAKLFNSSWTKLHESRGIETYEHKLFMRSTVIISELLAYLPAVIYYFYKTQPIKYNFPPSTVHRQNQHIYTALFLFYPAQILIDHGHFQYNCVFMGLTLCSIIAINRGHQIISSIMFTLALCYKQMSLYYSLPFFWFLASSNLRVRPLWKGIRNILIIGLTVSLTFVIIFAPYISCKVKLFQVIRRIFPFNRGLFEDKVANVWFSLSVFYKFRKFYSLDDLLKASTAATLIFSLPAGIHLLFRPQIRTFKYSLVTTSLVFFLFSFQVHEKTILVPALPILLLYREHPLAANWFAIISTLSLQPLLEKDGQIIPYGIVTIIYVLFSTEILINCLTLNQDKLFTLHNFTAVAYLTSLFVGCALSISALAVKPPPQYPHIHATLNAMFCCAHFVGFLGFFYFKQFAQDRNNNTNNDKVLMLKKTK